jgi:zinc D-Ala-D-Ala dipeptidase
MKKRVAAYALAAVLLLGCLPARAEGRSPSRGKGRTLLESLLRDPSYVDVSGIHGVRVDLRYAGTNNFSGRDLYGEFNKAVLHKTAARKLARAADLLRARKPGWEIVVFDALRPRSVQRKLWEEVRGTKQEKYIADPRRASLHNYGLAVDVSLADENGRLVDMGTDFDAFEKLSEPRLEKRFLRTGKLTQTQWKNRRLLRRVMMAAGFHQTPIEWWHFNAVQLDEARENYELVE